MDFKIVKSLGAIDPKECMQEINQRTSWSGIRNVRLGRLAAQSNKTLAAIRRHRWLCESGN
jgi:hypothetical protein